MPIAGQSRETLRGIIGRNLAGARLVLGTTTSSLDSTSVIDNIRAAHYNNCELRGFWIRATSGCNDGEERKATASAVTTGDITTTAFTNTVPCGMTFEAWPPEFSSLYVDRAINDAIVASYGRGYAPLESEALHTGGNQLRYSLPSTVSYLSKILRRTSVTNVDLHTAEATFNESVPTGVTNALDDTVKRSGANSLKFTITAAAAASALITDALTSTDFSHMTHVEGWFKSNVTIAAGAIDILIDDSANAASPIETLALPALTADIWTYVRMALAAPEDLTAIISVGIRFTTDTGAQILYMDALVMTDENTAVWEPYHYKAWKVDKANRGFYFTVDACQVGYGLLRIIGGQEPQTLTTDTATITIDDEYVIAKATASMFSQTGLERYDKQVVQWEGRALNAYKGGVARPAYAKWLC